MGADIGMRTYNVRFEADGADLFVELHSNDDLNRLHLLEQVMAILEDRHGLEIQTSEQGDVTRVEHSDGSELLAWLSIAEDNARQALDDDGLDEILTCLAFLVFPPVVDTTSTSPEGVTTTLT